MTEDEPEIIHDAAMDAEMDDRLGRRQCDQRKKRMSSKATVPPIRTAKNAERNDEFHRSAYGTVALFSLLESTESLSFRARQPTKRRGNHGNCCTSTKCLR